MDCQPKLRGLGYCDGHSLVSGEEDEEGRGERGRMGRERGRGRGREGGVSLATTKQRNLGRGRGRESVIL